MINTHEKDVNINKFILFAVILLLCMMFSQAFAYQEECIKHSWVAATCETPKTCKKCGLTSGSALGHKWQGTYYDSNGSSGHRVYQRCSRCADHKTLRSEGHSMDTSITKQPTCTSTGTKKYTCTKCGYSRTESISATGHDWSHYYYNDTQHWKICNNCSTQGSTGSHRDPNDTGYCIDCGKELYHLVLTPTLETSELVYNGQVQHPTFLNLQTTHLSMENYEKTNVGNYTCTISFAHSADKWKEEFQAGITPDNSPKTYNWQITPKHVQVVWDNTVVFECDKNTPQIRNATVQTGIDGETIILNITTAQTSVGEYIAHAEIASVQGGSASNYVLENADAPFRIIDTSRPTITVTPANTNWTKNMIRYTVDADDLGSGVNRIEYSFDTITWKTDFDIGYTQTHGTKTFYPAEGYLGIIYFRAVDNSGNISEIAGPKNIRTDITLPTFKIIQSPTEWTNGNVIVKIIAEDDCAIDQVECNVSEPRTDKILSAVNQGTDDEQIKAMEVTLEISYNVMECQARVSDKAGNKTDWRTFEVNNIDKVKPTISVDGEDNGKIHVNYAWIEATDDYSGVDYVGISSVGTEPTLYGEAYVDIGEKLNYYYHCQGELDFLFPREGNYTIYARDKAGNVETKSIQVVFADFSGDDGLAVDFDYESIGGDAQGNFIYDGNPKIPQETVYLNGGGPLIRGYDYDVRYSNNVNVGIATVTIIGKDIYKGQKDFHFRINERPLTITPDSGQAKLKYTDDPKISFSYSNAVIGEVPKFTGELARDAGTEEGEYNITLGTLQLATNDRFLASNYTINFVENVKFSIINGNGFITRWKVPAGATIVLPIPSNATNDYKVAWGDGSSETITTAGFPTHTYENSSEQTYTVLITGKVKVFGYINDLKPTDNNAAKDYLTFTSYLVGILSFGNIGAERLGFSQCTNLQGTIPARSGFENLTSVENFFNECGKLTGEIPANFFKDVANIESARNAFNNCKLLTGSLDASIFSGCTKIKSFENTYKNCEGFTGSIPANIFATNVKVENFAGVFKNIYGITGEIPTIFANNTLARSFSEAFAGDTGLTIIPDDLFANNVLANNFYRTFYNNTEIQTINKNLLTHLPINQISNDSVSNKDFRGMFEGCSSLKYLELDIRYIGKEMFKGCSNIEKVLFKQLVQVGDAAFYGCNKLDNIKIEKTTFVETGENAFMYTGANAPLLTYFNLDNEVLRSYNWAEDQRAVDLVPPVGTVRIMEDSYPFTRTQNIRLSISVNEEDCLIAILNDTSLRDFSPEEIASIRFYDRDAIEAAIAGGDAFADSEIFNVLAWEEFEEDKIWTLSAGDEVKRVYVYFMDKAGNISNVSQDLQFEQ